jgi:hypothetical protein
MSFSYLSKESPIGRAGPAQPAQYGGIPRQYKDKAAHRASGFSLKL